MKNFFKVYNVLYFLLFVLFENWGKLLISWKKILYKKLLVYGDEENHWIRWVFERFIMVSRGRLGGDTINKRRWIFTSLLLNIEEGESDFKVLTETKINYGRVENKSSSKQE